MRLLFALCLAGCAGAPPDPTFSQGHPPPRQPPANAVGGFTADIPAATLMPGQETYACWLLPLEVQGPSRFVGGATLSVGPGLHHGNIVTRKLTGSGVRKCDPGDGGAISQAADVASGGAVLFGSSTQVAGEEWQSFPPGNAYRVRDGFEIVARMHYLNASAQPLTVAPRYQWYTVDEASVVHELGPFIWDHRDFQIAAGTEHTARGECQFVERMHVVTAMPHMHKLAKSFQAGFLGGPLAGRAWLDSPGFDPDRGVILQYDPPIDLGQGEGAWFACTWANTLDKPVTYGVGDNEMCDLFGYAWPVEAAYSAFADRNRCFTIGASP